MNKPKRSVNFVLRDADGSGTLHVDVDGGDTNLAIGDICLVEFGRYGKITEWEVNADKTCTAIFEIHRSVNSRTDHMVSIIGSNAPSVLYAKSATSSELDSWNTAIEPGDSLQIDLVAAGNVRRIRLQLKIESTHTK